MSRERRSPLTRLALPVFVPSLVWSTGYGALDPVVVLAALALGMSQSSASALAGASGVVIVATGPAMGALISGIGDKRSFIAGTLIAEAALALLLAALLAPRAVWAQGALIAGILALAVSSNLWSLARQAYVAESVPPHWRARGMSMLGGMLRLGKMVGPGAGAVAIAWWGLPGSIWFQVVATAAALGFVLVFTLPSPELLGDASGDEGAAGASPIDEVGAQAPSAPLPEASVEPEAPTDVPDGLGAAALDPVLAQARPVRERADRRSVLLLATCVLVLALVRTNRQVVIPLLGTHLGVSNELISATFAISTLLDVAVFYPSGRITDRYGRRAALIPTLLAMGVGFCLLATVTSTAWFIAAACLVGFGNGLGAGIVMTIGADLSPDVDRSKFLGVWQSLSTIGTVVGPFLVSAIVAVSDVEWATAITGFLGLAGAAWSWFWVPVAYRRIGIDERGRRLS